MAVAIDLDSAISAVRTLSERHTDRLGCRGFDLLRAALAPELKCEAFLTSHRVQGEPAHDEGLSVIVSASE